MIEPYCIGGYMSHDPAPRQQLPSHDESFEIELTQSVQRDAIDAADALLSYEAILERRSL